MRRAAKKLGADGFEILDAFSASPGLARLPPRPVGSGKVALMNARFHTRSDRRTSCGAVA
jgi:hypothetical protein